ncbi:MAG: AraC family transcriptional regulator [Eubacteriales bacterium]|nr:AraC family transcriptional regulator [Eubacteriales bacterium]
MKIDIHVMQDASEIVHYDTVGIPLYIRTSALCNYPGMRALCHWHEDLEMIRVLNGRMNYHINGKKILLEENECLMVNSRQMHYGYSHNHENCTFTCILFHPQLFTGSMAVYEKYVKPYTENPGLEYLYFYINHPLHKEILGHLDTIASLKSIGLPGYEMAITGNMNLLWSKLLSEAVLTLPEQRTQGATDLMIQKDMVSFIHQHYAEKILLSDIAAAGNVSRSKCCIIFNHYLQQTPIDFLNHYRLEVSCNLLRNTDLNITDIAFSCGFNHLSYYSKIFMNSYGYTPSQFRKLCLNKDK